MAVCRIPTGHLRLDIINAQITIWENKTKTIKTDSVYGRGRYKKTVSKDISNCEKLVKVISIKSDVRDMEEKFNTAMAYCCMSSTQHAWFRRVLSCRVVSNQVEFEL